MLHTHETQDLNIQLQSSIIGVTEQLRTFELPNLAAAVDGEKHAAPEQPVRP